MIWTKERPKREDAGKWYFVRNAIGHIHFRQIRLQTKGQTTVQQRAAGEDKDIYLCPETHDGITKTSYGTRLDWYPEGTIEFCGPIEMPPDYRPNSGIPPA